MCFFKKDFNANNIKDITDKKKKKEIKIAKKKSQNYIQ